MDYIKNTYTNLYYKPFLGWLYLYGSIGDDDPVELNRYLDTTEAREWLQTKLGAWEARRPRAVKR